jgi:CDP-paratose 2-epimerase
VPVIFASTNKVYGVSPTCAGARTATRYVRSSIPSRARHRRERHSTSTRPMAAPRARRTSMCSTIARSFGVRTAVLRMSCIYGPRQIGTEDQGWVAHFLIRALRDEPISIYGDGCQVRDILHVSDAVEAYSAVLERIEATPARRSILAADRPMRQPAAGDRRIEDMTRPGASRPFAEWRPATSVTTSPIPQVPRHARLESHALARSASRLAGWLERARRAARHAKRGGVREVALVNPPWSFDEQHLFRLPRAAPAAGARLRQGAAGGGRARGPDAGRPALRARHGSAGRAVAASRPT